MLAILMVNAAAAELSMPAFFGDHMVLQADKPVKIWGQSSPGAEVSAVYNDQTARTRADEVGKWSLKLPVMQASAVGATLSITDGQKTLQFEDVLVGEVWFASGQSNINWPLKRFDPKQEAIRTADYPEIRFFQAKQVADGRPNENSGFLYREHRIIEDRVYLQFSNIGTGLKSRDGETLRHFEIQDEGGNWHWAQAEIKEDHVAVWHPDVKRATAARYAWAANPATANLVNSAGLPASLFTTEAE